MFKLNLKIALRNLWRNKGFALINIGGLAIGLASCMILLLYVAYEWGFDKQFSNYENIYVTYNNQKTATETFSFVSVPGVLADEVKAKLNKDLIKLVVIANCIAFPIAYIIVSQWLSKYEYKVDISVLPFVLAASLSIVVAILTVSIQSLKVAKSNPIDALKYE